MANVKKDVDAVKGILDEFKAFISRGNVIDLAVGVIIGGAFGKIVSSLVDDILMPIFGMLLGGLNFSSLSIVIGDARINYGVFIQNIINFIIVAAGIFFMVKIINKLHSKNTTKVEDEKVVKKEDEQLLVLKEIRDQLKKSK